MRGVIVSLKPLSYLLGKAFGRLSDWFYLGPLGIAQLSDVPEPQLPGDEWVKIDVIQCGICGSDVAGVTLKHSPMSYLRAFVTLPIGLGHEIVGRVVEVGSAIEHMKTGDRVVMEPYLTCRTRGIDPPCRTCARGDYSVCENLAEGNLPPGTGIGSNRFTGGGWGERVVAFGESCFVVPDTLSDDEAMCIEPLTGALHAVCRRMPRDDETVLVYGAGSMGLYAIMAIRALGIGCRIISVARHPFQAEFARSIGADEAICTSTEKLYERFAELTGGRIYSGMMGNNRIIMGGADHAIDAIGSTRSVTDSLRFVRARGTVTLMGMTGPRGVDWTPVWFQEVTLIGSMGHAEEPIGGSRVKAFDQAIEWVTQKKLDLARTVTHHFPLEQWQAGVRTFRNKKKTHAIKIALRP